MAATVYRMTPVPDVGTSIDSLDTTIPGQLEVLSSLEGDTEVARLLWQPNEGHKVLTVSTDSRISLSDFASSGSVQVGNIITSAAFFFPLGEPHFMQTISHSDPLVKVHNQVTAAGWSPHHGTNHVAVAMENNLQVTSLFSSGKLAY